MKSSLEISREGRERESPLGTAWIVVRGFVREFSSAVKDTCPYERIQK